MRIQMGDATVMSFLYWLYFPFEEMLDIMTMQQNFGDSNGAVTKSEASILNELKSSLILCHVPGSSLEKDLIKL